MKIFFELPRNRSFILFWICASILAFFPLPALASVYVHHSPLSFAWDSSTGTVDHYNVYLSVDGQAYEKISEVTEPACQVDVEDGGRYLLQVDAEDAYGNRGPMSDPSEETVVFLNGSADDTDGDTMNDDWEVLYGFNPYDPSDGNGDADHDGLSNREEFLAQTSPTDSDTDDDGVMDGAEVLAGLNPRDPADNVPVAHAGEDQEVDPTMVGLDGSGSFDPNGDPLAYSWTQAEGVDVSLSDSHVVNPAFLGKKWGTYRFQLVVNDGRVDSLADEVLITVRNVAPTADAGGNHVVDLGAQVVLDGSGSRDPNEDALSFVWAQEEGPAAVSLQGQDEETCSFIPQDSGVYRFSLVVSDGERSSEPDEVQVIVNGINQIPTADAGEDSTASVNTTVTLDGSGSSDPDGNPLTYSWSQEEGPASIVLEGASTVQPQFLPAQVGVYRFRLIVNDGEDSSAPDDVTVTVEGENHAPVAVVTEGQSVIVGDWVELNGEESFDPDNDPITYAWFQIQGPQVSLQAASTATAGFYAVNEGVFKFQLVVDDGELYSAPAEVEVTVENNNQLPVADAGEDFEAFLDSQECLDGSDSFDPDPEDVITFSWSQMDGPLVTLSGADTATPCFTPGVSGEYVFGLVVSDGDVQSAQDSVTVYVDTPQVEPPVVAPAAQKSSSGGGCASLGSRYMQQKADTTDLLFVLTLFLPALGMTVCLKRRLRKKGK